MAFRFIDGFDHYVTADITKKWTTITNSPTISASGVRNGTGALSTTKGTPKYVVKGFDNQATWIAGVAVNFSAFHDAFANPCRFLGFMDAGSNQVSVYVLTDGALRVSRNTTALATTAAGTLSLNTWAFVELKATIHSTAGAFELRVNGVTVLSGSGLNTQNTGNASASSIMLGTWDTNGNNSSGAAVFDDFYLCDATGATHNDFLGDVKVLTRYPQGPGTYSQLTPTGAAANWDAVDEATPDGDTTYVASATVGQKDTYDFAALSDPGAIKAVQLNLYSRKEDAGTRLIKPYIKSGVTEQAVTEQALSTDYQYKTKVWETDPNTGLAFTASGLDAAEFGLEVA